MQTEQRSTDKRRRALLIVNESSRTGASHTDAAAAALRNGGLEIFFGTSRRAADLSPCILAHRDDVDCVVLGGGDGTLNAAARGLMATGLPLGVLPLGTANDFARSVGVPFDLEAAARVIAEGYAHAVDIGEVNGHPFFNVASVGLAADLAKRLTREGKRRFGRLSYAITAARCLMEAAPFHATLLVGNEKVMVRTLQIAVGNGRYYGGGNVVAPGARIDDQHLDLYSLEFSRIWRMALMLPHFKRGEHGAIREVRTARGVSFEVITRKPRPVNADGELVTHTPAVFTQRPRAINVYVPETCSLVTVPA
ncbi:Lipid kinase [Beijerinckiaceae bacterium RH AL1]|nr:lipid kinase [Beijerinckiaceae bacterium]VVB45768.1 Lipid kinase [Beijerinckiaceae bacterium RH CH11]VVB45844.1 Lipid kinase [Beijerinckiaceae bacterium RH AL8]VVC55030.1 Lipid kinase [Beijerinckiaceae bacterium RH AL1]